MREIDLRFYVFWLRNSAANDFWGKTFLTWTGEKKMTQGLSIATGCSAGATESFVVVPFELVKIKWEFLSAWLSFRGGANQSDNTYQASRQEQRLCRTNGCCTTDRQEGWYSWPLCRDGGDLLEASWDIVDEPMALWLIFLLEYRKKGIYGGMAVILGEN